MRYADLVEILERELGHDLAVRGCAALCREAAGETLYIPRRVEPPAVAPTDTVRAVQVRYGVAERTARNWVNRWRGP